MLAVGASAAVLAVVEVGPLLLDAVVVFELDVAFGFAEAFFIKYRYEIGE